MCKLCNIVASFRGVSVSLSVRPTIQSRVRNIEDFN